MKNRKFRISLCLVAICGFLFASGKNVFADTLITEPALEDTDTYEPNSEIPTRPTCEGNKHVGETGTAKQATCTEEGYFKIWCNECGVIIENETYIALGHDYVEIDYTEPTCVSEGKQMYSCKICRDVKVETISKKEHIKGMWEIAFPSTATSGGKKIQRCTECGKVLDTQKIDKLKEPGETEVEKKPDNTASKQPGNASRTSKKVKLNKTSLTMKRGSTFKIIVKNKPKNLKAKIKYKTSNKEVASVNSKGKIKAKKKGRATITVKIGKATRKMKVRVK